MARQAGNQHLAVWLGLSGCGLAAVVGALLFLNARANLTDAERVAITSRNAGTTPHVALEPAALPLSPRQQDRLFQTIRELDPRSTGWDTEAFSETAQRQLHSLAQELEKQTVAKTSLKKVLNPDFRCERLRPSNRQEIYRDATTVVRRFAARSAAESTSHHNLDDFKSAVFGLPGSESPNYHVKLKITGVELLSSAAVTVVFAEGYGSADNKVDQWTATWKCDWTLEDSEPPKLMSLQVMDYEEAENLATGPWFQDQTELVIGSSVGFREQLTQGMDYWLGRLEGRLYVSRLGHNGIAIGDVNGDGRDDLYVCQSGGLPNRLYVQQADGTARDVSQAASVDFLDDTTCALIVDFDNDGDQDLALATIAGGLILENDGQGCFQQRAYIPECQNAFSLTAADYDQDRRLDLYVGRYWPTTEHRGEIPIPVPYFDGQNGGRNVLLRNLGQWQFEDTTASAGLDSDNTRYTMAAAWEDIDDDGDVDLYVANDFGKNCLYENDGGRFRNIARDAGVEDIASGMSVTFADFDHDDHWDVYVSNMFSSAGNRIAYQRQYEDRFHRDGVAHLRRMARGNSLFRNSGETFTDVSLSSRTTMGRWAWGSIFADVNNDGWDDLVVLNGNITAAKPVDL